jgi:hypothetical protein
MTRTLDEVRGYLRTQVNSALRRLGMYGDELSLILLFDALAQLRYAELTLDRDGDQLRVSLHPWSFDMPRRHRRPPAVRLAAGQWLRWQINYRSVRVNGGEWHYRLDTFNVAFGTAYADLFLGEPTRKIDELASLR